jgi:hypothetical protein
MVKQAVRASNRLLDHTHQNSHQICHSDQLHGIGPAIEKRYKRSLSQHGRHPSKQPVTAYDEAWPHNTKVGSKTLLARKFTPSVFTQCMWLGRNRADEKLVGNPASSGHLR